jgi:hypothetical protein
VTHDDVIESEAHARRMTWLFQMARRSWGVATFWVGEVEGTIRYAIQVVHVEEVMD